MSLKLHFLGDVRDENGENFHQYIANIENTYV